MPHTPQSISKKNFEVRTMPQKFLNMRPSFKSGPKKAKAGKSFGLKKNLIIGIIVIVVLGALMALAAWLFLRTVNQESAPPPTPAVSPAAKTKPKAAAKAPAEPAQDAKTLASREILDFNSWLTYNRDEFNFNFKYPKQWKSEQLSAPDVILHRAIFKDDKGLEQFKITVFRNQNNYDLLSWIESLDVKANSLESYSLNNQPAYIYRGDSEKLFNIYASYGQNLYSLEFKAGQDPTINKAYNQILITFRFTGEPVPPDHEENQPQFSPAVDSDLDGLTDREEEIYGSDKLRPDTDGDSYTDGDEVANLYNPTIAGSARLYQSPLVSTYVNSTYNYNIIYPAAWQVKGSDNSVLFQDEQGEFIQVLIEANEQGFSDIIDWYNANISSQTSTLSKLTVAGQTAVKSPDGLRVYFLFGDNVYSFIYNIGLRNDSNFMTTFAMMMKSFKLMSGQ